MIATVTMNPAIDLSFEVDEVHPHTTQRARRTRRDPGGNGVNAARMATRLGSEVIAYGFAGGRNGQELRRLLDGEGVRHAFVAIQGESRTNVIVSAGLGPQTRFLLPGPRVTTAELAALGAYLDAADPAPSTFVVGGSAPASVPRDRYGALIAAAKRRGACTILDADAELLRLGIEAGPYLVKPNQRELSRLVGRELTSENECLAAAHEMRRMGVEVVVLSLGAAGALMAHPGGTLRARPARANEVSKVGAGDSMVGAMAHVLDAGGTPEEALRLGVAAGMAAAALPGTEIGRREEILRLASEVVLQAISG
jgi:6-phosphofructokinase 2